MADVLYLLTFVAFFAVMVAFVHACERIVGTTDVGGADEASPTVTEEMATLEEAHP